LSERKKKKNDRCDWGAAPSPPLSLLYPIYLSLPDQPVHDRIPRLARRRRGRGRGSGGRAEGEKDPVVGASTGGDRFLKKTEVACVKT